MTKKIFVLLFSIAFVATFQMNSYAAEYAGPDTSPDGLQLSYFSVRGAQTPAQVGDNVKVSYKLKNVTQRTIVLSSRYGAFVGARWNSTTDANNRDFGHQYKGKKLKPDEEININAQFKFTKAGTWRFWPAYSIKGKWGPFRWHEIVVDVVATGTPGGPPAKPPATKK